MSAHSSVNGAIRCIDHLVLKHYDEDHAHQLGIRERLFGVVHVDCSRFRQVVIVNTISRLFHVNFYYVEQLD